MLRSRWLPRPLARFLRFSWLSRVALWPKERAFRQAGKPGPKSPPRPPVRLDLGTLESRETPDDWLGLLSTGVAAGGLTLLAPELPTPWQAVFAGWNPHKRGVPAPAQPPAAVTHPWSEYQSAPLAALAGLLVGARQPDSAGVAAPATLSSPPPARPDQGDATLGGEWLNAVGAFFDAPATRGRPPGTATDDPSPAAKGSGGAGNAGFTPSPAQPLGPGVPARASAPNLPGTGLPLTPTSTAKPSPLANASGTPASPVSAPASPSGVTTSGVTETQGPTQDTGDTRPAKATLGTGFGRTPLAFEVNVGQAPEATRFLSRGPGFTFSLEDDGMTFAVARPQQGREGPPTRDTFRLTLPGVNPAAELVGRDQMAFRTNYFVGSDPSGWHTNVPNYSRLEYREVYPGVDLIVRERTPGDRVFEYDFDVKPGHEVSAIRLGYEGLTGVSIDEQGRLLLQTPGGTVIQDAPVLYQEHHGVRTYVPGRVVLRQGEIGFEVTGQYDRGRTLRVDPVIGFASYLGGSGYDVAQGVAVDGAGISYVLGTTNFTDTFITKLTADGTQAVYTTYLGSTLTTVPTGIAVDPAGNAYVTGWTTGSFPTTPGAYQTTGSAYIDTFVAKLNATGDSLAYSTYLSGTTGGQQGQAVAVDALGNAYVTGNTGATDFPTTSGVVQTAHAGGTGDGFVTKLNPTGTALVWSTLLGGTGYDDLRGIAVDGDTNVYVTGQSESTDYPVSTGAYQASRAGGIDAVVSKLNPTATTLSYSTYVGGSGNDGALGIAVDLDHKAHVTGNTASTNFPTVSGAKQTANGGGTDAFVSALNAAGTALSYSTYYGGSGTDAGYAIAVDAQRRATVAGSTASSNLPTYTALQNALSGSSDAFVARFATTGTLTYGSYLGGGSADDARGVALDPRGNAYAAGLTYSTDLPGTSGGYLPTNQGGGDAFLAKILPAPSAPKFTSISSDTGYSSGDRVTTDQTLTLSGTSDPSVTITLERTGAGVLGSVAASVNGTWTYDYSGTSLGEGTYAFRARAQGAAGTSDSSDDFLVTVDRTAPAVSAVVPATTTSFAPAVLVVADDAVGVPATATVTLDVDLNNDSDFLDASEAGYATGNLTDGQVTLQLPALPATGTYPLRARVTDLAGNEGTSSTQTVVVQSVTSAWTATARVLSADPLDGDHTLQSGDVAVGHGLDLDQSPGTGQGGRPALVYHSQSVSQKPIVQVTLPSVNNAALPANVVARLTFDGTAAATVTYSTSGFAPGDVFTFALQASNAITTTGRYGYSVLVQVTGQADQTVTGSTYVVAQDASPLGAGWTFAGVDRLVSISADANGPAGMLRAYGTGGWRFYQGTSTFTSPDGDNGTLTVSGGTYTYSTPDGQAWTFNSSGYQTLWTSADTKETLQYRYDGSNRLNGITAIDGGLTTFTYTGSSSVAIQTVNSRTTTLTLSSGDLTSVTNPDGGLHTFTYNGDHRVTREQFAALENNWAYTSAGTVGTLTWGATSVGGVTNLSRWAYAPASTRGLSTLVAGTVFASVTDPTGATSQAELDERGRTLQTVAPDGGVTGYSYSAGFVTGWRDPLGRQTTLTLDGQGYVTKATLPDGAVVTYQYQSSYHALTTVVNERGNTTTFAYDGSGHLTRATDALGNHTTYGYNSTTGLLEAVKDARGNTTTLEYDGSRRVTRTVDALGNGTSYSYDANGTLEKATDALLRVTTLSHDSMGRLTGTIDPLGQRTTATYDASGLLLTTLDALLRQTSTIYDDYGRGLVVEQLDGVSGSWPISTVFAYDDSGRVQQSRDAVGATTALAYDGNGRPVSATDALGAESLRVYDLAGQVEATRSQVGVWDFAGYNSRGWQTQATDDLGNVTTLAYDAAGNMTSSIDPLGRTTTYQYDSLDRPTVTIDPLDRRVTVSYDAVGNVSTLTDPLGRVGSATYDAVNRLTKITEAVGTGVARTREVGYDAVGNAVTSKDGLNTVTTYVYDALDRVTRVTDALNHSTTLSYNAAGSLIEVQDALGKRTTYTYNGLQQLTGVTDALNHTRAVTPDALGRTVATVDALGNVDEVGRDALGRAVTRVDALGGVTFTEYYGSGGMHALTDSVGNRWTWGQDELGRSALRTDPAGAVTTTAYDAVGRVTSVTDRNGRSTEYTYDNADRVTAVTWKSAAGATVNLLTYTYDGNDNRLTAKDYQGTVTYTFDELNRAKTYKSVFGQTLTYTYDGEDRVTKREDSLGGVLTSTYNAVGLLTSRQFGGSGQTPVRVDFAYTDRNEQSTIARYSDLAGTTLIGTSAYSYDDAGRLTGIVNKNASNATLSYYNYSYDNADRVSSHTWWSQVGTTTYSGTRTYSYDATSQLTDDSTTAYSYDANGNRTMAGYATGTANRMTNDGVYTYTYDAEGNLTQKSKGASQETWYYTYDNANRLTNIRETSDGSTDTLLLTYTYDAEGKRVKEQAWGGSSPAETRFVYDGADVMADLDSGNTVTVRRMFGNQVDQVLARTVASGGNAGLWIYNTDNLGSVRDLVDANSQVKAHLEYDGFGVRTDPQSSTSDRYGYTGREWQCDAEIQYNRERWFGTGIGRWTQEDPMHFRALDTNLFRYVRNAPVNNTDPSGLQTAPLTPPPSLIQPAIVGAPNVHALTQAAVALHEHYKDTVYQAEKAFSSTEYSIPPGWRVAMEEALLTQQRLKVEIGGTFI